MGTQNRLVTVLAAVVAILFFIFVGLAVNYYSSAQAGNEAPQEDTTEVAEPIKEDVSPKTEKKNISDVTNSSLGDAENQKKNAVAEKKKAASPQPKAPSSYSDRQKAEYALTNFHKKITDKEYTAAYNCLTKSYRKSLNYNSWVDSLKTTVSSMAYDINATSQTSNRIVLKYILRSEDKPGEIQYFSGEASIVKSGDEWKIDRIQNKKM